MCQFFKYKDILLYFNCKKINNIMKLNEEEMYNAHPWLLTVPRVGIVVLSSSLSNIFP